MLREMVTATFWPSQRSVLAAKTEKLSSATFWGRYSRKERAEHNDFGMHIVGVALFMVRKRRMMDTNGKFDDDFARKQCSD